MLLETMAAVITSALADWMGHRQGVAVGNLFVVVQAAHAQIEVAQGLLRSAADPRATPEQSAQLIRTAQGMVDDAHEAVTREAFRTATAIPADVVDAFTNFGAAAENAVKGLAKAGAGIAIGWLVVIVGALYFFSKDERLKNAL